MENLFVYYYLPPSDLQTFLQLIVANAVAKSTNRQKYIPITAKYDNFQAKLELAKKVTKKFVKSMIITS